MRLILIYKKIILAYSLILFSNYTIYAQKEAYNWYFGGVVANPFPGSLTLTPGAGITFNSSPPTALTDSKMSTLEGVATISDTAGNLLFYTDGTTVYNALHDTMPNGTGLLGSYSSTQSGVAIKHPGDDSLYFLFTVDAQAGLVTTDPPDYPISQSGYGGLAYSMIDMRLDGGLGDIVLSTKNTLLVTPTAEKLTAVRHCNGNDIWLITHGWENDSFYVFLITDNGIEDTIYQKIGMIHQDYDAPGSGQATIGYLKSSPDGSKLALAINDAIPGIGATQLFDFDNQTGNISNAITLNTGNYTYGISFSPDNSKLYVTRPYTPSGFPALYNRVDELIQYDLSTNNEAQILASKKIINIPDAGSGGTSNLVAGLQNGSDGKMYVTRVLTFFLDVIHDPNLPGASCQYQTQAVNLSGKLGVFGLPNFVESFFLPEPDFIQSLDSTTIDTALSIQEACLQDIVYFIALPRTNHAVTYHWDFGDPASGIYNTDSVKIARHIFSDTGNFIITLIIDGCETDTIIKEIHISGFKFDLGEDTTVCIGNQITFEPNIIGETYLWSNGDTLKTTTVSDTGIYILSITIENCSVKDSVELHNFLEVNLNIGDDTTICKNDSLLLVAGFYGAESYQWNDNSSDTILMIYNQGTYSLALLLNGCLYQDSITIETEDCNFFITAPTIFSPNNDGVNDFFEVFHNGEIIHYKIEIFNRWGEIVFESAQLTDTWDGLYEGNVQENGTYHVSISSEDTKANLIQLNQKLILLR